MNPNSRPLIAAIILIAGIITGPVALAQDRDERWYRVELLIFSHEGSGAATSEAWDPRPPLSYPEAYRFLRHPEREAANIEAWPGAENMIDERGVQTITVPEPATEEDEADDRLAAEDIPSGAPAPQEPNDVPADPVESMPPRPTPWIARPAAELEFRGKAAYMQRSGRYQTLFHETWLQPMAGETDSIPIVIDRSGDQQTWPQLQGSVRLYLSRFLHLETNLWLNTAGSYIPGSWSMKPPPMGPLSLIVIEPEPEPEETTTPYSSSLFGDPAESEVAPLDANEPTGPLYPWRHAVALAEKRRMRSEEVHYLDHPMLGLVIKLTPLAEEELEDLAAAEALADQDA